jgi:hypothetical protein
MFGQGQGDRSRLDRLGPGAHQQQHLNRIRPWPCLSAPARALIRLIRVRNGWSKTRRDAELVTDGVIALDH